MPVRAPLTALLLAPLLLASAPGCDDDEAAEEAAFEAESFDPDRVEAPGQPDPVGLAPGVPAVFTESATGDALRLTVSAPRLERGAGVSEAGGLAVTSYVVVDLLVEAVSGSPRITTSDAELRLPDGSDVDDEAPYAALPSPDPAASPPVLAEAPSAPLNPGTVLRTRLAFPSPVLEGAVVYRPTFRRAFASWYVAPPAAAASASPSPSASVSRR